MKQLALLVLIGLTIVGILACGGETAEPTAAPQPTVASTLPAAIPTNPPAPADTPVPAPTDAPAPKPEPTDTPPPVATATSAPTPTATPAPEPTATPEPAPTATQEPEPTPTPEPEPTATTEPTATPAPEPTPEPEPAIASDLAPLGDNLRFVAYLDRATQKWFVYDATGHFQPEDIPLPPGMAVPDASDIGALTELVPGAIYTFVVDEGQTVELGGSPYIFYAGSNLLPWQ